MKKSKYVIVRTYSAGCFAGELVSRKGKEVVLNHCRRLWRWSGAASLSQLAVDGTKNPNDCKFPAPTMGHTVTEAIEIIPATKTARISIEGVPVWKA